jgi:hypothetical protein
VSHPNAQANSALPVIRRQAGQVEHCKKNIEVCAEIAGAGLVADSELQFYTTREYKKTPLIGWG